MMYFQEVYKTSRGGVFAVDEYGDVWLRSRASCRGWVHSLVTAVRMEADPRYFKLVAKNVVIKCTSKN